MSTASKLVQTVNAKTADYTLTNTDWGAVFTNRGAAGAVTFTLPPVASTPAGAYAEFFVVTDQTVTIAGTAGELTTFNDAAANSVAFSTSAEKLGAAIKAFCDGTKWLIFIQTEETATVTVAT
jgi:hypothetical protein